MLAGMGASGADAALALGDLGYGSGETQWCDLVRSNTGDAVPFQLLVGNHEEFGHPDGDIAEYAECLPNGVAGMVGEYGTEYLMDFPSGDAPLARVIMAAPGIKFADGVRSYSGGDEHEQWLRGSIREARQDGIRWVIVAAHKPCPTIGVHECETEQFAAAAIEEGADLVLHGHEHAYLRTHQLSEVCDRLAVGPPTEGCIADSDNDFTAGEGTVFVTVGTGGIEIRPVTESSPAAGYFAAWSNATEPSWGYLDLRLDRDQLAASFVTTDGAELTDAFVIQQP